MQHQYRSYLESLPSNNELNYHEIIKRYKQVMQSENIKKTILNYCKEQQIEEALAFGLKRGNLEKNDKIKMQLKNQSLLTSPLIKNRKTKGIFIWPINQNKCWLSSLFGPRKKANGAPGFHNGIDLAACRGTHVYAVADGVIEQAASIAGYGNTILLVHNTKYKTRYAHLNEIKVKSRQQVKKGDLIGTVGDTGFTIKSGKDASHLHFEVYEQDSRINPLNVLI